MPDEPEQPGTPEGNERPSMSRLLREAVGSASALAQSEARLARIEFMHNIRDAGRQSLRLGAAALLLVLGGLALLAALVIALGSALGGHYGWSALAVGGALVLVSAWVGGRALRAISTDTSLPLAKMNLRDDETLFSQNIVDISDRIKPRGEPGND